MTRKKPVAPLAISKASIQFFDKDVQPITQALVFSESLVAIPPGSVWIVLRRGAA